MDHNLNVSHKTHFHIHWAGVAKVDWEPFDTREGAEQRVLELRRPGENNTIEEYDESCPRCGKKTASAS
jgi:hypothetical protein